MYDERRDSNYESKRGTTGWHNNSNTNQVFTKGYRYEISIPLGKSDHLAIEIHIARR